MKSVSLSQVVRAQPIRRLASPVQSWRALTALVLTLSLGLALIALAFMALDPGAPTAYIIVPVVLGGALPLFVAMPGQFDVNTRFSARHLVKTLDSSLEAMGYMPSDGVGIDSGSDRTRRYSRPARLFRWKESTISLAVHDHAITIGGPLPALRQLQHRLRA